MNRNIIDWECTECSNVLERSLTQYSLHGLDKEDAVKMLTNKRIVRLQSSSCVFIFNCFSDRELHELLHLLQLNLVTFSLRLLTKNSTRSWSKHQLRSDLPIWICCTFPVFGLPLSAVNIEWNRFNVEVQTNTITHTGSCTTSLLCSRGSQETKSWSWTSAEQTCVLWWRSWSGGLCTHHTQHRNPPDTAYAAPGSWLDRRRCTETETKKRLC